MEGRVYSIIRPGEHDDFSHPNAVIVRLGPDAYLCVAGFTPGKTKYEAARAAEHKLGIWGPAFAVDIDHARHLTPVKSGMNLHLCGYVCNTSAIMTVDQIRTGREWGTLSEMAVRQIADGLLARQAVHPLLPKKVVAALKRMLES